MFAIWLVRLVEVRGGRRFGSERKGEKGCGRSDDEEDEIGDLEVDNDNLKIPGIKR